MLLVIADKALLIPQIRDRYTTATPIDYNILSIENEASLNDHHQKQVWAFGTSRTIPFSNVPTTADIENDTFIDHDDRIQLRQYRINAFALPGSVPIAYLHHYLYLKSKGYKPDLVWIEVSPFVLNRNYLSRRDHLTFLAPDTFIIRHWAEYPVNFLSEWTISQIIKGSVFPPTLNRPGMLSLAKLSNPLLTHRLTTNRPSTRTHHSGSDRGITNFGDPSKPGDYRNTLLSTHVQGFLNDYTIDTMAMDCLKTLMADLTAENIPFLLWVPPVHPNLTYLDNEFQIKKPFTKALQQLTTNGQPLIQISINSMNCQLFRDESHLSPYCYTELAAKLLSASKTKEY